MLRSGAALASASLYGIGSVAATASDRVTVLTQNLYLGSALAPVLQAETESEFEETVDRIYQNVLESRFEQRAEGLAGEIADVEPDVIGLQEAARFVEQGDESTTRDYLETLLEKLEGEGLSYTEVASVDTFDAEVPVSSGSAPGRVRFLNSDVILAREGVKTSADDASTYYTGGREFGIGRGYCSATVEDTFTFVNTHLSTRRTPLLQLAQASELLIRFRDPPTVLVGDFNSGPSTGKTRAYDILTRRYSDAYAAVNPDEEGETCCQHPTLTNETLALGRRIDHVFTHGDIDARKAERVGHDPDARVGERWPSDHAGVMAELELP
ncbi:hypothetical protein JCM30237_13900 [Halolamina litorea]